MYIKHAFLYPVKQLRYIKCIKENLAHAVLFFKGTKYGGCTLCTPRAHQVYIWAVLPSGGIHRLISRENLLAVNKKLRLFEEIFKKRYILTNGTKGKKGNFENQCGNESFNCQWDFPFRRNLTKNFGNTAGAIFFPLKIGRPWAKFSLIHFMYRNCLAGYTYKGNLLFNCVIF